MFLLFAYYLYLNKVSLLNSKPCIRGNINFQFPDNWMMFCNAYVLRLTFDKGILSKFPLVRGL